MKFLLRILPLLLFASSAHLHAQSPSVSGNWNGTFDIVSPSGTVEHHTTYFTLTQDADKLTGSAGATEHQLTPITDGRVTAQSIHFAVPVRPGTTVAFDLHLEADHLRGEATGFTSEPGVKVLIDTTRTNPSASPAPTSDSALYDEISLLDTALFTAYNSRNLAALQSYFSKDLEFYHDKTGLSLYQQNIETFKSHFDDPSFSLRRELVPGTLEVYPLANYGAVEIGVHRFYNTPKGQPEQLGGTAKFIHVWHKTNGTWQITRVISYDHR